MTVFVDTKMYKQKPSPYRLVCFYFIFFYAVQIIRLGLLLLKLSSDLISRAQSSIITTSSPGPLREKAWGRGCKIIIRYDAEFI